MWSSDVDVVVVPASACGSPAVLALMGLGPAGAASPSLGRSGSGPRPLLVAVEGNETVMDVTPERLGLPEGSYVRVRGYAEALGVMAAHKAGVSHHALGRGGPVERQMRRMGGRDGEAVAAGQALAKPQGGEAAKANGKLQLGALPLAVPASHGPSAVPQREEQWV